MESTEAFYLLKPCRTGKAFKLKLKGSSRPPQLIVDRLLAGLAGQLVADAAMLKVVKHGSVFISIHANGDMLLRNVDTEADARELAARISVAVTKPNGA